MRACQPSGLCLLAKHGSRLQTTTEVEKMFEYNERIQRVKNYDSGRTSMVLLDTSEISFEIADDFIRQSCDKVFCSNVRIQ